MNDDEQPAGGQAAGLNQAAIDWAWVQSIANNPGARMALLCLARRVDETWECTASQEEVAVDAMVPARSMRRYLEHLEDGGFIERLKRLDEKGQRLPSVFRLNPRSSPTAILASGRDQQGRREGGHSTSSDPTANLATGQTAQWPNWPLDKPDTSSSEPTAILAVGKQVSEEDEPSANLATGSDQQEQPPANLADGQGALWGDPQNGETGRSGPVANLADGKSRTRESSSSKKKNKKEPLSSGIRDDVEQLCNRLLSWLVKKDYRNRPDAVTEAWRTEARLLLDKDGADLQEALAVLDWSQRDGFWHKNINSMPTFRTQYGQLELKSRGARGDAPTAATGTTHQRPTPLPPRVGGYENAKNFGRKRS
ncbi:hypothetical protein [Nonomuraea sp. NPDC049129]|uniref:hypothetical protein n=1 Tax=Nonomuraea sp. NPDC049129 TaxID=3155272 RepID=UPI0033CA431E